MLDVRYNRDQPGTGGNVLGETQWRWLEAELRKPATLRLIVSGFQILLDAESGSETWALFPEARQRLFDLVRRTGAQGAVFITGDQHYAEVCRLPGALDYDAVELQFAGINQTEKPEYNSYRVSSVGVSLHSYGLIDIQWEASPYDMPHLLYRAFDAGNGQVELTYRINFPEINLGLRFVGEDRFARTQTLRLDHAYPGLELRYTLDGSGPTPASRLYTQPSTLRRTTTVKARFVTPQGDPRSPVFDHTYTRLSLMDAAGAVPTRAGLHYSAYEGRFERLPDFDALQPVATGHSQDLDVARLGTRPDSFALHFEGYFEAPADGVYTFALASDDGARLLLHEQVVVDNDGSHARRERQGQIALRRGLHPLRITYFDDYAGQHLSLRYRLDGGPWQQPALHSEAE
ncbi:MAG: hypothetical protein OHK0039_40500 [Bacteroidia bacterium]